MWRRPLLFTRPQVKKSFSFNAVRIKVFFFLSFESRIENFGQVVPLHFYLFTPALVFSLCKINKSPEAAKPCLRRCRQLPQPPRCQGCAAWPAAAQGTQPRQRGCQTGISPRPRCPPSLTLLSWGRSCCCRLSAVNPLSKRQSALSATGARFRCVTWMFKGADRLATSCPRRNTYCSI